MKNKTFKIIASIFSLIILFVFGAAYYLSTKITPDDVRKHTVNIIQKEFPNAKVKIENIELSFGFSVNLKVDKLQIDLDKNNRQAPMASLKDLKVTVPLWSILLNSGRVDVLLDSPQIFYREIGKSNNWSLAMGTKSLEKKEKTETKVANEAKGDTSETKSVNLSLPASIINSSLNFKMTNVLIDYQMKDSKGKVEFSKFLVRDLNLNDETAYEVQSDMDFNMGEKDKLTLSLLLIGEVNLGDYLSKNYVETMNHIKIKNIKSTFFKKEISEIQSDINLKISSNGVIEGTLDTSLEGSKLLSSKIKMQNKEAGLRDIKLNIPIGNLMTYFVDEIKGLDLKRTSFKGKGDVIAKGEKLYVALDYEMTPFTYNMDDVSISTSLKGDYKDNKITASTKTDLLNGQITSRVNAFFDPNVKKIDIGKLKPYRVAVDVSNINVTKEFINKFLYAEKPESNTAKSKSPGEAKKSKKPSKEVAEVPILPRGKITLDIKNIKIDKSDFRAGGAFSTRVHTFSVDKFNFNLDKGNGNLSSKVTLTPGGVDTTFKSKLKNIDFNSFSAFLPPVIGKLEGIVNGGADGKLSMKGEKLAYNISYNINAKNGKLEGLNLSDKVNKLVDGLNKAASKVFKSDKKMNPKDFSDSFESLSSTGTLRELSYVIKTFSFIGKNKKLSLTKGNGTIYPPEAKKKSTFFMNISHPALKKYSPLMTKYSGDGFILKPDVEYTAKKLLKSYMKKEGKKKVKKKAKKAIDKLLKGKQGDKLKKNLLKLFN